MATSTGYYVYGFTDCPEICKNPGPTIGEAGIVQNIPYQGVGILCSPVNGKKLQPTRKNLMAHQKVLEAWMKEYTVLPVRFGTVSQSKGTLHHGIRTTLPILRAKLRQFKGKHELNLKAFWEKEYIYNHILEKHPGIKSLREKITKIKGPQVHYRSVELGQEVERALLAYGEKEAQVIIDEISSATLMLKKSKVFGELMFLNLSVLVNDQTEHELDQIVNRVAEKRNGKVKFKYNGPSAPASFVDIHLKF